MNSPKSLNEPLITDKVKNAYFFLGLIVLVGLGLRTFRLNNYSIWYDEKSSLSCAVGIPHPLITAAKNVSWQDIGFYDNKVFTSGDFWKYNSLKNVCSSTVHSHGYFIALHFWVKVFGTSDFAVRFLSVLLSCLVILVTFALTNLLFKSHKIALLAAFLTAINPNYIESAQYTRSHTMVLLITLLSTYFYYRIFFAGENKLWLTGAYFMCIVTAVFSHFYCVYVFFAHAIITLFFRADKKLWLKYAGINLAVLSVIGVYLILGGLKDLEVIGKVNADIKQLVVNWKEGDNPHYMPASARTIFSGLGQAVLPAFGNSLQNLGFRIREIIPFILIPVACLFLLFFKVKEESVRRQFKMLLIIFLAGPLFSLIMSLGSGYTIFFTPCYSMYSYPYLIILMAFSFFLFKQLSPLKKNLLLLGFSLQVLIMFISLAPQYNDTALKRVKNPYPGIVHKAALNYSVGDTLIYSDWLIAQTANLYMKNHAQIPQKVVPSQEAQIVLSKSNGEKVKLSENNPALIY